MKNFAFISALMGIIAVSSISHAQIRLAKSCQSADKQFSVEIFTHEVGDANTPVFGANVYDANDTMVGQFAVTNYRGRSESFGSQGFNDSATNGQKFHLDFGNTNNRHSITLEFTLQDGTKITREDLNCGIL